MSKHIFCEVDELYNNNEWKEFARWLKFEEDVELGGRWSKPHVATLSLHSLFELRKCLSSDPIFFDLSGEDLITVIDKVLLFLVQASVLKETDFENVKSILLSKHIHQHEKDFQKQLDFGEKKTLSIVKSFSDLTKIKQDNTDNLTDTKSNSNPNENDLFYTSHQIDKKDTNVFEFDDNDVRISRLDSKPKDSTLFGSTASMSNISRLDFKTNQGFMKKIPEGTEAANVLIGEVDFLEYQFSIFIRLSKAVVLGDLTEVPVPTRFLFILLGPKGNLQRYREIGRSIATLISDEIFLEIAYTSKNKQQLLKGFDTFLDQVIVIPPGEWDPSTRLEPPNTLPQKEERLQRIAQIQKNNSFQLNDRIKGVNEGIKAHYSGPGLEFTGRLCGGLIDDLKRKLPWYLSDFKDGLNFQCLSSILFMYFACLAPIITFGGLLGAATDNNMSAIESLVSGAVCGILFSFFAGQPLCILGSTGPVLVFEKILNTFCKEYDIDYMGFRALIGLWMAFFLALIVCFDISAFVKYITRFTEESFAALIAFIFIKESFSELFKINQSNQYTNNPYIYFLSHSNNCNKCINDTNVTIDLELNQTQCERVGYRYETKCQYVPDIFFFSALLFMSTFLMAMTFRSFRNSRFFPSAIRSTISDFGVIVTIFINVMVDSYYSFNTPKLAVPLKFENTIKNRGWFIDPIERIGDKWWLILVAIIPAVLSTILIFMDQQITAVIVNRKENKLKKSFGYHLDLLVVAVTIAINSLLGIPWFVAATVLSINNIISLRKESESSVPGEKPKFLGVIEQRLTGIVTFALIGSSVFLAKYLQRIPMPVLYGIFLYMGITSLNGMQFMQRLILPLMPEKHQPDYSFLRYVRTYKVHLFTLIQIFCLILLFLIKMNKTISISFPIMVLALVGIRKLMDYIFTQKELYYLDQIIDSKKKSSKARNKELASLDAKRNSKNDVYDLDKYRGRVSIRDKIKEPFVLNNNQGMNKNRLPPPQIVIIDTDAEN